MIKLKKLWNLLTIMMVAMLSIGLSSSSCGGDDDDDNGDSNSDLVGYWVKEAHLNNPSRNGSGGTVTSYGYQFLSNGTVYVFQLHHTGLSSRYSYAEANTSWERLTERNGVSFYINPDKNLKTYRRVGNEVYIDITDNPTIMSVTGSDRMEAISLDGWAEGTYVKVGTGPIGGGGQNGGNGSDGNNSSDLSTMVWFVNDSDILMGVNDAGNGWYSYVLQFGFGVNDDKAYNKGMKQLKLTVWADNGCTDMSFKTSNYGKKNTYTLNLSTDKEMYKWIYIQSKDQSITFNYELEYYDSNDGRWYDVTSRIMTFKANGNSGGGNGAPPTVQVTTNSASDITATSVTLSGSYTTSSGQPNKAGFLIGTSSNLTIDYNGRDLQVYNFSSSFSKVVYDLSQQTTYFYRAYVQFEGLYYYGETKSFTTSYSATTRAIDYYIGGESYRTVLVEGGTMEPFYIMQTEIPIGSDITVDYMNVSRIDANNDGIIIKSEFASFLKKLRNSTGINFRLPTKEEWQFAAKGGNKSRGYTYSGSNSLDAVAWYKDNSDNKVHGIAKKQANELGLYDMSGNYAELCANDGKDDFDVDGIQCGGCWQDAASACTISSWKSGSVTGKISGTGVVEVNAVDGRYVTVRLVYSK